MRNPHKEHLKNIKALGTPIEWVPQNRKEKVRQPSLPGFDGLPQRVLCPDCNGRTIKDGKTCKLCRGGGFLTGADATGTQKVGSGGVPREVASRERDRAIPSSQDGGGGSKGASRSQDRVPGWDGMEASSDPFENGDLI